MYEIVFGSDALAMSVRKGPAMMQLTRTLGPKACANASVSALRPAFAAAYGVSSGVGRIAAMLLTLMIDPPSPAAMRVPTLAIRRNGPLRLTPSTLSHSASLTSASDG